jgi:hypothetical protein
MGNAIEIISMSHRSMLQIHTYNLNYLPFTHSAASGSENQQYFMDVLVKILCIGVYRKPRN